jgi:hypothetical protein
MEWHEPTLADAHAWPGNPSGISIARVHSGRSVYQLQRALTCKMLFIDGRVAKACWRRQRA